MEQKQAKETLRQQVFKSSVWSLSTTIVSRLGGLIFTILLARFLLPEGFGLYSLATSIALIFIAFADLGINQAMIRFVSLDFDKNKERAAAYFGYILKIKRILAGSLSILLFVLAYPLAIFVFHNSSLFYLLLVLSIYSFFLAMESFYESLFYIGAKVKYLFIKEIVLQSLRILAVALIFLITSKSLQVLGIISAITIVIILVYFVVLIFTRNIIHQLFRPSKILIDKREVLKFIGYLTVGGISGIFFGYVDTVMLGFFVQPEYIGYYRAAATLIFGIAGLFSFVNVFIPVLTRMSTKKLSDVFNRIIKYSFMITIPACFGIIFLASYVLRAIYGYGYLPANLSLYFLAPMIILTMLVWNISALFSARGILRSFTKVTLIASLVNIILNYLLINLLLTHSQLWATAGAAIATLLSWALYCIYAIFLVKKQLAITLKASNFLKPLLAAIVMSLFLFYFNRTFRDMTLTTGILEILIGALIYFIVLLIMGSIKKEEFLLIQMLFR